MEHNQHWFPSDGPRRRAVSEVVNEQQVRERLVLPEVCDEDANGQLFFVAGVTLLKKKPILISHKRDSFLTKLV